MLIFSIFDEYVEATTDTRGKSMALGRSTGHALGLYTVYNFSANLWLGRHDGKQLCLIKVSNFEFYEKLEINFITIIRFRVRFINP